MRILTRTTDPLLCELTKAEALQRGQDLARSVEDIQAEEGAQETHKRAMKSKLSALEARRDQLALIVSRGQEVRDIEVELQADDDTGKVRRIRMDTGEVLLERPMTDAERQVPMPL